ncbi:hypothetical protein Y1Q_0010126 [Alligator mississippiensis]|uniref:Uncharacterized protein n=1 Tax=Alligator mississippiensis TaxID=8496 RepID=A0A151NFS6_ALLMI|nr:hypothetical protein Y1Q_0010126 [Alligator mississippiensis]
MPGAIRMRRLRRERRTQRESWQQEALRVERLRRQEAQDFHNQVLQELRRFRCDHAVAIEEVKAGRVALERLVTQIERERQLVLECLQEMRQLRAPTVVAVAHEQGH